MSLTGIEIRTCPTMPYKVWAKELALIVSGWYKLYNKSNNNPDIVSRITRFLNINYSIFGPTVEC